MYKAAVVHYKNKYPGGLVIADEHSINVYCSRGMHRVALRKNGAGMWTDESGSVGARDQHSLDPIPKNSRVHKLYVDGTIAPSEEAQDRLEAAKAMAVNGRVPSIAEFKALGAPIDSIGNLQGAQKVIAPPKTFEETMAAAAASEKPDAPTDVGTVLKDVGPVPNTPPASA